MFKPVREGICVLTKKSKWKSPQFAKFQMWPPSVNERDRNWQRFCFGWSRKYYVKKNPERRQCLRILAEKITWKWSSDTTDYCVQRYRPKILREKESRKATMFKDFGRKLRENEVPIRQATVSKDIGRKYYVKTKSRRDVSKFQGKICWNLNFAWNRFQSFSMVVWQNSM